MCSPVSDFLVDGMTFEIGGRKKGQKQTAEAENAQDQTMDPNMQEDYNKATNAYSGKYGQEKDLDEVTKDQIDKILHEKAEHIHQLFENGGVE